MHIEIYNRELETLIKRLILEGHFSNVEDALLHALRTALPSDSAQGGASDGIRKRQSLEEVFAKVRGLADDIDFSRDSTPSRTIDLS